MSYIVFYVLTRSQTGKVYKKMQCLDICLCISKKKTKKEKIDKDNTEVCEACLVFIYMYTYKILFLLKIVFNL